MSGLQAALAISLECAGRPGGVAFTEGQLYYELCRTLARSSLGYQLRRTPLRRWLAPAAPPLTLDRFREALDRYGAELGRAAGLLPPPAPISAPISPPAGEPDAIAYGLHRLLVCQSPAVAAMLRANLFHLELSCITLSWAEAIPLPAPLLAMLARAPRAHIFLLHDASPDGLALLHQPAQRLGLPTAMPVVDLGLRPRQAWQGRLPAERQPSSAADRWYPPSLTTTERQWLAAGWTASVEAISPAQLLRGLRRAMLATGVQAARDQRVTTARQRGFMTWPNGQ